ncbi:ShlB/FhaC/HecB family hemolysin secretion/activation protein [Parvibaculum sp.]|uniref:ShlB/FhaC/HecB family hemolysin secretion/activation protein n=1 Tax=Parvibaculum sp. TaxID=2024848 RepID=UPI002C743868|nr:ShlB/FhaC/HecB family hemolysin secretion/activation protein [Parvibaculum sp.]HUD51494.1 ShlB/FhaC/HecB family hemolysin secretion/activation protein [Parvibaculum sp.]
MKIGMRLLTATSSLVLAINPAFAASPLTTPSPGTVLAPPPPSPDLPRREVPKLRENLGLPNGAAKVLNFRVARVRIMGATVVDEAVIARQFDKLLNKPITALELRAALDSVNKLYEEAGYALGRAFVPPQVVQGGTLIVRVVEGYIGDIKIKTDSESARQAIEVFSRRISSERPLTTATLERYLLLMSDIPGVKVAGQLSGMNIYTGAATLDLTAEEDRFTLDTALDNRANLDSSPFQTYLTGAVNNILGDGEQLSLTVLATPNISTQQYFRLAYTTFIGSDGLRATLGGSFAQSKAGDLPPGFDLVGRSSEIDAALTYPFVRSLKHNVNGTFGAYAVEAYNDLNGMRFTEDAIRAVYADGTYAGRLTDQITMSSSVRLTQGLGILGGGPDDRVHSRLGASPWFFKARASANVAYAVTPKFALSGGVDSQYSPDSLYSSEEIPFGGAHFGRGFDTSEVSGDSGYGTSLQAQYRLDSDILGGWSITPYTFLDHSRVYNKPVDGQGNAKLVSTGIGVTVSNRKWLSVGVEADKPLNRDVSSRGNKDPRLYFSLEVRL